VHLHRRLRKGPSELPAPHSAELASDAWRLPISSLDSIGPLLSASPPTPSPKKSPSPELTDNALTGSPPAPHRLSAHLASPQHPSHPPPAHVQRCHKANSKSNRVWCVSAHQRMGGMVGECKLDGEKEQLTVYPPQGAERGRLNRDWLDPNVLARLRKSGAVGIIPTASRFRSRSVNEGI